MCRHVAYTGPALQLSGLLTDVPHGMEHQSYAPRELLSGVVCADGYGIAWVDEDGELARYAFPGPIWSDGHLRTVMPHIRSTTIMAAVRNATIAGSNTTENCAPFLAGGWAWSLNGFLENVPAWLDVLQGRAPQGATDAELLFMDFLHRLEDADHPGQALQEQCRALIEHGRQNGLACQLNMLASKGDQILASRAGSETRTNSLYILDDGDDFPDALLVASEPVVDDAKWKPVGEQTVVVLQSGAPPVHLRI